MKYRIQKYCHETHLLTYERYYVQYLKRKKWWFIPEVWQMVDNFAAFDTLEEAQKYIDGKIKNPPFESITVTYINYP